MRLFSVPVVALAFLFCAAHAQTEEILAPQDTVAAFLKSISGKAGVSRSIEEINQYLDTDARTMNAIGKDGKTRPAIQPTSEWLEKGLPHWEKSGYIEECLKFEVQRYGNIAQVMCPYVFTFGDNAPVQGVVSLQLFYTGTEWKILSYLFTHESPDKTINERFELEG